MTIEKHGDCGRTGGLWEYRGLWERGSIVGDGGRVQRIMEKPRGLWDNMEYCGKPHRVMEDR